MVFVIYIKKRREVKSRGRKMIMWRKYRDNVAVEYKERMRVRYEEISKEAEDFGE